MLTNDLCTTRVILCDLVGGCLNSQSTCMHSEEVSQTRGTFLFFLKRRQTKEGSRESRAGKKGHHALGVCVLVVARLQCVICLSLDVTHLHNPVLGGRELSLDGLQSSQTETFARRDRTTLPVQERTSGRRKSHSKMPLPELFIARESSIRCHADPRRRTCGTMVRATGRGSLSRDPGRRRGVFFGSSFDFFFVTV